MGGDVWSTRHGPLLYAHRGAHAEWPENSIEAFRAALEIGADVLETDVRLTSDGHVVASHDATLDRVAGVALEIGRSTLRELRSLRLCLASGAAPARPVVLPSLDEVLEALPGAWLNVDVKQGRPDMTAAVLETIARHRAERRVLLTSFEHRVLSRLRARYRGPTGLSRREAFACCLAPRVLLALGPRARRLQIPVRYGALRLGGRRLLAKMHSLGIAVDYWGVDDPALAECLLARGADGIVTDRLREMAVLFTRSPHTVGWRARHGRADSPSRTP